MCLSPQFRIVGRVQDIELGIVTEGNLQSTSRNNILQLQKWRTEVMAGRRLGKRLNLLTLTATGSVNRRTILTHLQRIVQNGLQVSHCRFTKNTRTMATGTR